jgi:hypothetical protein
VAGRRLSMRAISAAIVLLSGVILVCVCIATPFQERGVALLVSAPGVILSIIGFAAWCAAFYRDMTPPNQPLQPTGPASRRSEV